MDFTIVIPTCNRPQMLPRALASALRQTHDRYEIVVVDDASDRPVAIENPGDPRVTLLRSSHRLGFAGAINFGAIHARGRWIAFLDDDDEYEPDLLRHTFARLQAMPHRQFSWCSTVIMHYDGDDRPVRESVRRFPGDYESEEELLSATVSVGSGYGFSVSREVFHNLGGFDQSYWAIADTEFFFRLIAAGHRPAVVSEPVMRVHKHGGPRMTNQSSYRNRARQCELLRIKYADLIGQHPRLGEYIRTSIDKLTAMALAFESHQVPDRMA
jgi:glycosyltransferase involved in cell wall biosynthesis